MRNAKEALHQAHIQESEADKQLRNVERQVDELQQELEELRRHAEATTGSIQ